jgi:hypothetical protein
MLRSSTDESLVLSIGKGDGLREEANELLVDLGERGTEVEAVRDGFEVADLHRERQGAEGFVEDRGEEGGVGDRRE